MNSKDSESRNGRSEVDMKPPKRLRTAETLIGGEKQEAERSAVDVVGEGGRVLITQVTDVPENTKQK